MDVVMMGREFPATGRFDPETRGEPPPAASLSANAHERHRPRTRESFIAANVRERHARESARWSS
ncbi:hypothetical protein [Longimicrobium sp.]|uniref:hypothetical protein n=1 Tax=Longimicrobium sp. TaxID=2029185 RepID=UPI002E374F04|nr:hypothetical protein [Longimicrobium sp.]